MMTQTVYGAIIRRERIAQNMSQQALADGICAVSYLSKIENGKVFPNDAIVRDLMAALNIHFPECAQDRTAIEKEIETFFEQWDFCDYEAFLEAYDIFSERYGRLIYLPKALILEGYVLMVREEMEALTGHLEMLADYEAHFNAKERMRFDLLCGWHAVYMKQLETALKTLNRALGFEHSGVILQGLAIAHYIKGNYDMTVKIGGMAYEALMSDGNLRAGTNVSFGIAAAYANQNRLEEALSVYKRIYHLTRHCEGSNQLYEVYYNMASSYLMSGDLEQTRIYLDRAIAIQPECTRLSREEVVLLYQKYALLELESGDIPSARVWIKRGLQTFEQDAQSNAMIGSAETLPQSLESSFLWLAYYLEDDDPKMNPAFLMQLEKTYQYAKADSHFGFQIMYGNYLVAILVMQRRYKDALRITRETNISWKTNFNSD